MLKSFIALFLLALALVSGQDISQGIILCLVSMNPPEIRLNTMHN